MKGFEAHHRFGDFLNETVILFHQVVQIFDLAYFHKIVESQVKLISVLRLFPYHQNQRS